MTYEELNSLIDQYQSSAGEDLSSFRSYLNTMAGRGKTSLGLKQWQSSDKPVMEDFNENNRIIDENLRGLWEEKASITAPIKYDLGLSSSVEKYTACDYFKTEDSVVTVNLFFSLTETITDMIIVATLPVGFRPSVGVEVPITVRGGSTYASLAFRTNGTIAFYPYKEAQTGTLCYAPTTSFLAAQ